MLKMFHRLAHLAAKLGCLLLGHDDGGLVFGRFGNVWLECERCGRPTVGWQTATRRPRLKPVVKRSAWPKLDVIIRVDASQAVDSLALLAALADDVGDGWRGNRKVQ